MSTFEPDVRAFLDEPWIGRLATNSLDGYPHCVPLWYVLDGDDVVIISERKTAKVANLVRDARAVVTVGGEPERGPAYMMRGRVTMSDDPDHVWLRRMTERYETHEEAEKDLADWAGMDIVVLRLNVERVATVY
ncbi:MAG TPA: TIGR03618 family F420-dependent PPOX class oxidoreductase [Candidatus Limnocylindrales bacterium]|nr:TIGR03618 family F420-dependent PPOX class oxidoreductase [Candidatus Limnocylindrales bacterium]